MKTKYIVKSYEEEIGAELFVITVPEGTPENEVYKNLEMASKYATVSVYDDNDDNYYDEHFEDMVAFRNDTNGIETFNYYLEEYCGYKVTELTYDFEYEW